MKHMKLFDNDTEVKFTVPQTWDDVPFNTYAKYVDEYSDTESTKDNRRMIELFCGLTREQVNAMEAAEMYNILGMLQTMVSKDIVMNKTSNYFQYNGVTYDIQDLRKMTAGQFEDIRELISNDTNIHTSNDRDWETIV